MLRTFLHEDSLNWDKWLYPLLFAVQPKGVLDLVKESWEEGPSARKSEVQYDMDMQAKLQSLGQQLSHENLLQSW